MILHAIEQRLLRGQRRVDRVGRPTFDFHTGPGARDGPANLDAIRQVKEAVGDSVVIVSNGNVRNCGEADEALALTKAGAELGHGGL